MTQEDAIRIAKAQIWEEAKGKLRALYAVAGQVSSTSEMSPDWTDVREAVEAFIVDFEDKGLHE